MAYEIVTADESMTKHHAVGKLATRGADAPSYASLSVYGKSGRQQLRRCCNAGKATFMKVILPVKSVWRSAQLLIAFHRNKQRKRRAAPVLWRPNDATARLNDDPEDKEALIVVRGDGQAGDVQIRMHPDKLILRRSEKSMGWSGVVADHHRVSVKVGDTWIAIDPDGSVKRQKEDETTWLEADGSIIKLGGEAEILISGNGARLTRRTGRRLDAITEDGILSKAR